MNVPAPSMESSVLEAAAKRSGLTLPLPFMELSASVVRDLPLSHVADLKRFEAAAKAELTALSSMIQSGLAMRYGEEAKQQLHAENKDTGTTHIFDSEFDVVVEISKDVSWDQGALKSIWNSMVASGQDPTEFITAKYSVSETRFKAWPDVFRQPFMIARTVKPKTPKVDLRKYSDAEGAR